MPKSSLLDLSDAAVRKMIEVAKNRGYLTYEQLNAVLPSEEVTSEQIEEILVMLNELGINVVEQENAEQLKAAEEERRGKALEQRVAKEFGPAVEQFPTAEMAAKVFISYRREDSAGYAGRIQDRLEPEFGRDNLFMDVDAIPLGMNFVKILREEVAKCGVLLAVMGPKWCDVLDEDGRRRLNNRNDFVRIEIATALHRDIPVIPILVDGATVPRARQLPKDLKGLVLRNGLNLRHASFHNDMDKLIKALRSLLNLSARRENLKPPRRG